MEQIRRLAVLGGDLRQISMNPAEHFRYQSQSPCTLTMPGHFRMAMLTGSAVLIPSFFAGMDAAVTMLLLSLGSPDTTEGTNLMSGRTLCMSCTAVQLRNAEFTSIWNMTLLRGIYRTISGT